MTKTAQRRQIKEEKRRVLKFSLFSMLAGFSSVLLYLLAEFVWKNGNQAGWEISAVAAAAIGAYAGMKAAWVMKRKPDTDDEWTAHEHKPVRAAHR